MPDLRCLIPILLLALAAGAARAAPVPAHFDIRLSEHKQAQVELQRLRASAPRAHARRQAAQAAMDAARQALAARAHGVAVIGSRETGGPEVVGPVQGVRVLTGPSHAARERIARDFVEANAALYGLTHAQAVALVKDAEYVNPAGNLGWVRLQQRLRGRPVFRGELTVALTPAGEIARTVGQVAFALDEDDAPVAPHVTAAEAVSIAAAQIGIQVAPAALAHAAEGMDDGAVHFARGPFSDDIEAELLYFPLGDGAVELAWSMVLWQAQAATWSIVGASTGVELWRKTITQDSPRTYHVYPAGSPAPLSPGPVDPTLGTQGTLVARSAVTVDSLVSTGDPWLADGQATTAGNNVQAGLDVDGINGVDAAVPETSPNVFGYAYNPPPGSPVPGEAPTSASMRNGAVVNLFFAANRYHDQLYDLGFTEAARNFQHDNYGRGGSGGDRISAEAQDTAGTNNANFTTPPDGGRGRMQVYLWTGPTPDRDGDFDADLVYHELTHGTSSRLHANGSGLDTNMSAGLGEGWSDFYAGSLLSEPGDPIDGIYPTGGYAAYQYTPGFTGNYYYGIRRFPRAPIAFVGANGKPHDPLTFADIDATQVDLSDGAFPRGPIGSATVDQVHNLGEVWSTALWEARAQVIARLGPLAGNQRMLQDVTDGMKFDPVAPTFLQARDAILAADCAAHAGASEIDLWTGFALRGMGLNAGITHAGTGANDTRVVEDTTGPLGGNVPLKTGTVAFRNTSCATATRNPLPGETVQLEFTLASPYCSVAIGDVVVGTDSGGQVAVGDVLPGTPVQVSVPYRVPLDAGCGSTVTAHITISSDAGTQVVDHPLTVGEIPVRTTAFTNPTQILVPAEGTAGLGAPYPSSLTVSGIAGPVLGISLTLNAYTHTYFGDTELLLVAPDGRAMVVMSDAFAAFSSPSTLATTFTLSDGATSAMPPGGSPPNLSALSYRPTNYGIDDAFAAPAPAGPYLQPESAGFATLSGFAGTDVNGTWSLYAHDDGNGDLGEINGGWTLNVVSAQPPSCQSCLDPVRYTIGGDVSGLAAGASVTVHNNGGDAQLLSSNGPFSFTGGLTDGATYAVTIAVQPDGAFGQQCGLDQAAGVVSGSNVTSIAVVCRNDALYGDSFE